MKKLRGSQNQLQFMNLKEVKESLRKHLLETKKALFIIQHFTSVALKIFENFKTDSHLVDLTNYVWHLDSFLKEITQYLGAFF